MDNITDIRKNKLMQQVSETRIPKPATTVDAELCPVCKGKGWLRRDVPVGHPQFGARGLVKCQCRIVAEVRRSHSRTYSWLGADERQVSEMEAFTFASFDPRANGESVALAYKRAKGYAADLKAGPLDEQKNGLFIGPLGVGKTHLACAVINHLRAAGISCLFASGNNLFQVLFARDFDESIVQQAIESPVFCLDDLSQMQMLKDGSYQKTTLFTIFNQRYIAHRPTIITASDDKEWREWLHPAVLSRLFGKDKVEAIGVQGRDYRMIGGK